MDTRKCSTCEIVKPLTDFERRKECVGGYRPQCKTCRAPSKRTAWKKIYDNNKEAQKQRKQRYYQENKEVVAERCRKYQRENRDKVNVRVAKKRQTDPQFRLGGNLRRRIALALNGTIKSARTFDLLGCSIQDLKQHLERQFDDKMTWDNYGTYWHVDHIMPCASFDLTDSEQQKRCFHYLNLRPLEAMENFRKDAKVVEVITDEQAQEVIEWLRSMNINV